jgi:hypothetical protein
MIDPPKDKPDLLTILLMSAAGGLVFSSLTRDNLIALAHAIPFVIACAVTIWLIKARL